MVSEDPNKATKWELIAKRKREAKLARSTGMMQNADTSWQIWVTCSFCGLRNCINNNRDREKRIPKTNGVFICVHCRNHGRDVLLTSWYLYLAEKARGGDKDALKLIRLMSVIPSEFRKAPDKKRGKISVYAWVRSKRNSTL